MTTDYRKTVALPRTDFPMKAQLPKREPVLLERWAKLGIYQRLRAQSAGREKFVLHDGPPYANGHIHLGTALNKILKDVIVRSQQMMGRDSVYVPGWDCHGLPIEWQIEQNYRQAGKDKDAVPVVQFRQECRSFAEHWIDVQREEFQRLGVIGDWQNPYTTMSFEAEAHIVGELGKFLLQGSLYRGSKPVMWSVVEKTALAEAEIEYHDHTSTTIVVRFPVRPDSLTRELHGASVVIWTTTPWTIPGNRAIAANPHETYVRLKVTAVKEGSLAVVGEALIVGRALLGAFLDEVGIADHEVVGEFDGASLLHNRCRHPLHGHGYDHVVPIIGADYVTMDQGSGFVHIAPGHGQEDFDSVQLHNAEAAAHNASLGAQSGAEPWLEIETPQTVSADGTFFDHVLLFAGKHVFKANDEIADKLQEVGALLARGKLVHSYPHSWRSKAPLIFRNTPQWFISMSANDLRDKALAAIDEVRWYPPSSRARIRTMIETRPDWVVSRQRVWGVPITVFVDKASGDPLRDPGVFARVVEAVAAEGAEAWLISDNARFLAPDHDTDAFEKVTDIVDVWFDSGCTHGFVLEQHADLKWPASLYLEGSDQHRGWFHSSLLESCGTRGRAPYEAVLTHGFFVDGEGRKMSKSLGNVIAPKEVLEKFGADILRLWVLGSDYSEDLRISQEILGYQADAYRRLRNTLRYLLGNLHGFDADERVPCREMPELERWVLHRLFELDGQIRGWCEEFDFHSLFTSLHNFCAVELSAFYFDVRKDSLYCDRPDSVRRRAARTVLDALFDCLTAWLAPLTCFTAEEAWLQRNPGAEQSVHLRLFPDLPEAWRDDALAAKWAVVRRLRRALTGALEIERADKRIGSSLEAHALVYANAEYRRAAEGLDLPEIFITSGAEFVDGEAPADSFAIDEVPGVHVMIGPATGKKCERCWQRLPDVGAVEGYTDICGRCADAVEAYQAAVE
jgi:isoleucyl-tRNA synthetase